jgi:hypothetical protein
MTPSKAVPWARLSSSCPDGFPIGRGLTDTVSAVLDRRRDPDVERSGEERARPASTPAPPLTAGTLGWASAVGNQAVARAAAARASVAREADELESEEPESEAEAPGEEMEAEGPAVEELPEELPE